MMDRKNERIKIRKGGLLDIPLAYNLIYDGSIEGSFTDRNLTGKGQFKLFFQLIKYLLSRLRFSNSKKAKKEFLVLEHEGKSIGFVILETPDDGSNVIALLYVAISPAYRGRQFGTFMVTNLINMYPSDTEWQVACTKYARAMQHILKKLGFIRKKKSIALGLNFYYFLKKP